LTPPAHAESLLEDIYPFNLPGFSFAPSSQNENTPNIPELSNAPFVIRQAPVQIAGLPPDQWQTQTGSNVAANFAAQEDKESSLPLIARIPTTDLGRKLWQARINASEDKNSSQSKDELRQIIRQISSVEFKSHEQPAESLIVIEPIHEAEPNEISSPAEMPQKQEPGKIEHKLPYKRVTDETLQIFKSLSQHPEQLNNPLELAEILFNSNCLKEAAECYREALNRLTADQTEPVRNADWLLFQTGNCLRNDDPSTAMQMYAQLIAEYPDSPWADLAKAKNELTDWYLKDTPDVLIDECKLSAL
jgi:tetratricopeptide (TPR) repeat protein